MKARNNITCPICGLVKSSPRHSMCKPCDMIYVEETGKKLGEGEDFCTRDNWIEEVLGNPQKRIEIIRCHLDFAEREYEKISKISSEEASRQLVEELKEKFELENKENLIRRIRKDVFKKAVTTRAKKVFEEKGGNRAFAKMRALQQKMIKEAKSLVEVG